MNERRQSLELRLLISWVTIALQCKKQKGKIIDTESLRKILETLNSLGIEAKTAALFYIAMAYTPGIVMSLAGFFVLKKIACIFPNIGGSSSLMRAFGASGESWNQNELNVACDVLRLYREGKLTKAK